MERRKLPAEECAHRIAYTEKQFEIHKMYAMYWQAMATTGVATQRNLSRGRPATEQEKAEGIVVGFTPLTDEQKTKEALDTMLRHIRHMDKCKDCIDILRRGEEPSIHDIGD